MLPGYLAIVMEYANQGDLASFMSKFVLHNVRCQCSDVTSASHSALSTLKLRKSNLHMRTWGCVACIHGKLWFRDIPHCSGRPAGGGMEPVSAAANAQLVAC